MDSVPVRLTLVGPPCPDCGNELRRVVGVTAGPWPTMGVDYEVVVTVTPTMRSCAGCGRIITDERNEP